MIVEIRGAEGGDDAKLFVETMYDMYQKFCRRKGLQVKELSRLKARMGSSEIRFNVSGEKAYDFLSPESGGHRVQRVPPTEANGRRHTSTVTVAVLKDSGFEGVKLSDSDVYFEGCRAQGNGGQNVNKVSSAVRLMHKETGETVFCQEERYQNKNRKKALKRLEDKLNNKMMGNLKSEEDSNRREQVGLGMRGDKIRTYNYREYRVTNHVNGKISRQLVEIVEQGKLELIQ